MSSYSSKKIVDEGPADVNGRVEFRERGAWFGVIDPAPLLPKHYDLFGLLFGVANFAGFVPLFPGRGLPDDCDDTLRAMYEANSSEYFGASWVAYSELVSIDWGLVAERTDQRIHKFEVGADGSERWVGKAMEDSLPEETRRSIEASGVHDEGHWRLRRRRISRADAKDGTDWDTLLKLMAVLVGRFGEENVRLVVFFD